jgi:ribosomal protein S18 acetylase RimI-like enzyme
MAIRIIDVIDAAGFARVPPCADPGFDHRSCDYWEDAARGSKAARSSWLEAGREVAPSAPPAPAAPARPRNPFALDEDDDAPNPFLAAVRGGSFNPFLDDTDAEPNPFAPRREPRPSVEADAPPKLRLLGRGLAVFGSYAKVLLEDEVAAAYAQFGPLSAYPRAMQTRELYPALPAAPLPAVITCIATTAAARGRGHAATLVEAVCEDLARRGFAAVETYPESGARPNATSAATPAFWEGLGFRVAAPDERFPVMRRELE